MNNLNKKIKLVSKLICQKKEMIEQIQIGYCTNSKVIDKASRYN